MTFGEYKTLAAAYARVDGFNFVEDLGLTVNDFYNRCLADFSAESKSLYEDAITFTVVGNTAEYEIRSGSFSKPMVAVEQVYDRTNETLLLNEVGIPGAASYDWLRAQYPNYLDVAAGDPRHFIMYPATRLRLFPTPANSASWCVQGWVFHPTLSSDSTVLSFGAEYHELAAKYAASKLLAPYASGASKEKQLMLEQEVREGLANLKAHMQRLLVHRPIRGNNNRTRRLG